MSTINYGLITEPGSLEGIPISIGGGNQTSYIILQDEDKIYSPIDLSHELAMKLTDAKCLYLKTVRLNGVGLWNRTVKGEWELKNFRVHDFEILHNEPLSKIVGRLRSVPGSGWEDVDDPDRFLRDLRSY